MRFFTSKELNQLFPAATERKYSTGQIVLYDGDLPKHMFFVSSGALKNYDIDENGHEKIFHIVGEQSFFSVLCAIGEPTIISSFYTTLCDTTLILIPIEDFMSKFKSDIVFSNKLFEWFVDEMSLMYYRVGGLEKNEGRLKIAQALQFLKVRHSKAVNTSWNRVSFPVSQQLLADLTGLTRETVGIILKDFDEKKIVRHPKQMILEINSSKLERLQ